MVLENVAAVLYGANDLRVEKWPMPEIQEDELLIRMEAVGICGSDVKLYSSGKCGFDVVNEPIVMGHEGAGVVIQVGTKVTTHKIGDRVAIEPTNPCRKCSQCKLGRYNLCPKPNYCSSLGFHGNLCKYYAHVADFCHKIPENLSMEEGAAVQPLAIAIHACNRAGIKLGDKVAILGSGPIGVLCLMVAKSMGATSVLVTDVVKTRLDTAKQLGADFTVLIQPSTIEEETIDCIKELLGSEPDVSIDACGFASAQRVAMQVTRSGGRVLVVGIGAARADVPLACTLLREVDILGSYRFTNTYPAAIAAVSSGAIDLNAFITDHFTLKQAQEAIKFAKRGAGMKIIIHTQK